MGEEDAGVRFDIYAMGTDDPYIIHLRELMKQVTYRINQYRLASKYTGAKDRYRYELPVIIATNVSLATTVLGILLNDPMLVANMALVGGFCAGFAAVWTSMRKELKYDIESKSFANATIAYISFVTSAYFPPPRQAPCPLH
mmetsp:Transcript_40672/g.91439  ORF Transcript_40672/g.91439 Transcript_40672/m.91439 type:complete len:142 (+) Transcript_40672:790-1215(+)